MKYTIKNVSEMDAFAKTYIESLVPAKDAATVVALSGDLGAGKTTFAQAVAKVLGVAESVTSPTFVIEKIYKVTHPLFTHLIHIDAYRLEQSAELTKLGFAEVAHDPHNLVLIEWPEKVPEALPREAKRITFSFIDETTREVEYE